jgi:hypothetical protein
VVNPQSKPLPAPGGKNHGFHDAGGLTTENTESTEKGKTINHRGTETQRKAREKQGFAFDFLCVSVSLWLAVFFKVFLRALRG